MKTIAFHRVLHGRGKKEELIMIRHKGKARMRIWKERDAAEHASHDKVVVGVHGESPRRERRTWTTLAERDAASGSARSARMWRSSVWEKFSKGGEAMVNFTGGKDWLDGDQREGKKKTDDSVLI